MPNNSPEGNGRRPNFFDRLRQIAACDGEENRLKLSTAEKLLLLLLANRAGTDGLIFPSQELLAKELSMAPRSVHRLTKSLEDREILKREKRGRGISYSIAWDRLKTGHYSDTQTPDTMSGIDDSTPDTMSGIDDSTPDIHDTNTGHLAQENRTPCPTNHQRTEKRKENPNPRSGGVGVFVGRIPISHLSDLGKLQSWIGRQIGETVSDEMRLRIVAAAILALSEGKNPVGFFKWLAQQGFPGESVEGYLQDASHWLARGGACPIQAGETPGQRAFREAARMLGERQDREQGPTPLADILKLTEKPE